jgi:carboxymethylenebutenolidase
MTKSASLLIVMTMLACSPKPAADASDAAQPTSSAPSSPAPGLTGALSEEEFKKLHELKTDAAPPLHGKMIDIGADKAYLSLPKGTPPFPAVVVVHEWWGLNDHIKHWADRLAEDGYAALAVDLYGGKTATTPDEAMAAMKAVDPAAATATLLAAHKFLASDSRVQAKKRGSIGWCFGGKWSLGLGLAAPDSDAVVMYYGHPPQNADDLKTLKAPLLGIFGNRDKAITPAMVDALEKNLKANGANATILRYDADHAFANPSNPHYDATSAADAWGKRLPRRSPQEVS